MSDATPTPDTVPEVIDDPTSPDGQADQIPYPDVDSITPDDRDDEQEDQA